MGSAGNVACTRWPDSMGHHQEEHAMPEGTIGAVWAFCWGLERLLEIISGKRSERRRRRFAVVDSRSRDGAGGDVDSGGSRPRPGNRADVVDLYRRDRPADRDLRGATRSEVGRRARRGSPGGSIGPALMFVLFINSSILQREVHR
jgi:hypothetical protein